MVDKWPTTLPAIPSTSGQYFMIFPDFDWSNAWVFQLNFFFHCYAVLERIYGWYHVCSCKWNNSNKTLHIPEVLLMTHTAYYPPSQTLFWGPLCLHPCRELKVNTNMLKEINKFLPIQQVKASSYGFESSH